jgi:HEAT repeat protein
MTRGSPAPHPHEDRTPSPSAGRRAAAVAGHAGDEIGARKLLADGAPGVRATALAALVRMDAATDADVAAALADPVAEVRRRACEAAVAHVGVDLRPVLADRDPMVVEAAAWALGERGPGGVPAAGDPVDELARVAGDHGDALCREAAVAALGAIGDVRGLPAILAATSDKPAVRRRAVIALAPFEGPEVDAALARALSDRDWQVRQAAEDLS